MWQLVPLSKGLWEDGVPEGWMVCPLLKETLGASGSRVILLEVQVFVDSNQPIVDLTHRDESVCFLFSSTSFPQLRS